MNTSPVRMDDLPLNRFHCRIAYREVTYLILVKNPGGKWIKRDLMG
ncbi:hypothetical protein QT323_23225 [Escherichia coli]|nr:hypothetical protein [Escherichia coli]